MVTLSVVFPPGQTVVLDALAVAVGTVEIDTLKVTPPVFPEHGEVCVLRTQYVVFAVGDTVSVAPVCPEIVFVPGVFPVPHW